MFKKKLLDFPVGNCKNHANKYLQVCFKIFMKKRLSLKKQFFVPFIIVPFNR